MGLGSGAFFLLAILAVPAGALAQPQSFPAETRWDAGASVGLIWGENDRNPRPTSGDDSLNVAYNFDLGRYWTTHLKTDVGVLLTPARELYDYEQLAVPGVPFAYVFTQRDRSVSGFSAAATYQFFENEMMHPYVSGGVQAGLIHEHRYRDRQTNTINRVSYTVPAFDARTTETLLRPFLAAGCKSYFNDRTFVRSELAIAVGPSGFSHATVRLGFGVDF